MTDGHDALRTRLLAAYDTQLRTAAETTDAREVERLGPLWLATFGAGRGFITYASLDGIQGEALATLVREAVAYFEARPRIQHVEWKTRGHDHAPGLHEALLAAGFVPDERETIMIGDAQALAVEVPLPEGVTLRRITEEAEVRAMAAMQGEVFDDPPDVSQEHADSVLRSLANGTGTELWVAEADGQIISAGRLEPVPNSDFAGIWGGSTRPEWRGRGIYHALTAARARSAIARRKTLIHSDSTDFSRPILERSGLVAVSTTTPYNWGR